jgi:hypothetical protein
VRKVPTPSGPYPFQLYFEDLGEIDEICLEALKRQSLLPSKPAPIRVERFVEKEFKTALRYEDLGPNNLGCTVFNSRGGVEAILISRFLEEQDTPPARDELGRLSLRRRGTVFCTDRSLLILRISDKTNGEYCVERKTF